MFASAARGLIAHALPILIAQLSSIGMMLVDTAVLGHYSAVDLATVAIGGGIQVSVIFSLVGILQAVGPVVAHLHGAKRDAEVAGVLQQGFWMALVFSVPGIAFLCHPDALLGLSSMDAEVEIRVREYLRLLAWGVPAALCYRTFYGFCNALGRPRALMLIGLASLAIHALLAWGFALQGWTGERLGALGCGLSNVIIAWAACLAAAGYLAFGPLGRKYRPFSGWGMPHWPTWRELLRLGLPMGLSNLVEITSFTFIALFVASLGATVVAGHRIVANLAALCYMLPLSLAIAAMSAVGQAVGARDWKRAHAAIGAGLAVAAGLSTTVAVLLWLGSGIVVDMYTDDPAVRNVAVVLVAYIAFYQFFDAIQTVAAFALRAYRVTFIPMVAQTFCFWGIGLAGGWWLCYRWQPALGVGGFWLASVASLVVAAALLGGLLWKTVQATEFNP
ncbi:MAG: MATE family efflux transporter [Actinomycetota bacterium]